MKVLFVSPDYGRNRWIFPYAFAFLSSYAKKNIPDISIDYVDVSRQNIIQIEGLYRREKHDVIALTGLTSHYGNIKELINYLQKLKADHTKVIIGGAIISSYPEFMIRHLGADYYFCGEGEEAFVEFLQALRNNKSVDTIRNIGYLKKGEVVVNELRPLIKNLDFLPWQDYDNFDFKGFMKQIGYSAMLFGSRGCPFDCGFCYRLYGSAYRPRSNDNLIEEMKHLIKKYRVYSFRFADELFFMKKSKVEDFCHKLMQQRLGVTWSCSLRVDVVNADILKLMHQSGCISICYGIESGSQEMLDRMHKRATVEQNRKALQMTMDASIFPALDMIIGYPGETKQTIKETEHFLEQIHCHGSFHFMQALPGTAAYEEVKAKGLIRDEEAYFNLLGRSIQGLPMDLTGMGKEFIESEEQRIAKKLRPYYDYLYKRYQRQELKFYLKHFNLNFFYSLPERLWRKLKRYFSKF